MTHSATQTPNCGESAVRRSPTPHDRTGRSVRGKADFDDAAGAVAFRLEVNEGPVYRMGELAFRGIDNNLEAKLRAAWKIRTGEVYDASYLKQYLPQARKLLPASVDWEVSTHVTALVRDKTIDVDLQYMAKAPH